MYSPNEVNKANDKSCNRRRGDAQFNPVRAINHVQRLNKGVSCRNREYISAVKIQFKEFNELMNQLDPNEDDSDSDKETKDKKSTSKSSAETPQKSAAVEEIEDSDRDTDGEMPKPKAPLEAIRQSTALKKKKKKHADRPRLKEFDFLQPRPATRKRGSSVQYAEGSSSDSDEEFHGF